MYEEYSHKQTADVFFVLHAEVPFSQTAVKMEQMKKHDK